MEYVGVCAICFNPVEEKDLVVLRVKGRKFHRGCLQALPEECGGLYIVDGRKEYFLNSKAGLKCMECIAEKECPVYDEMKLFWSWIR